MRRFIKIFFVVNVLIALIIFLSCSSFSSNGGAKEKFGDSTSIVNESAIELQVGMRKLWEDHIIWTRNVILCVVDELPGSEQAMKRLLQNQVDIGSAIKPYYGDEAAKKLTELLYAHINISMEVIKAAKADNAERLYTQITISEKEVKAAKAHNTATLDEATRRWYANADEISGFFNSLNPNWTFVDMQLMMNDHLKLTTDEAIQRIKKDYDMDIIVYDKVHTEILKMSDMLSDGIIKQFSEKFKINTTGY